MKNLYKYIVCSLLTASTVGMFLIGYSTDRMQKKVTKFNSYVSTELGHILTELDDTHERMRSVRENGDRLLVDLRRFNEELRLRQIIREELGRNDLRRKLE